MGGFAWVTLATNDSYSLGALVLAHSLKKVGTNHQLAVLVTPGVTSSMREKLATVFNIVQEVNILDSKDEKNLKLLQRPELGVTFTKLHCWRLTQFDKCVFLDADTLVLKNCDELFDREELSAAPDVGWPDCFNSGVFVYCPNDETYDKLIQFALDKGSFDGGDQGLLNLYFSDWATKDINKHLPFIYNLCSTACYSYLPAFKQFGTNAKIIHFIGSSKPWLQYFNTETRQVQPSEDLKHLQGILQHWWNIFCSMIHSQLTPDMAPSSTDVTHTSLSSSTSQYPEPNIIWDPWEKYDQEQSNQTTPDPNPTETYNISVDSYTEPDLKPIESHNTNASCEGCEPLIDENFKESPDINPINSLQFIEIPQKILTPPPQSPIHFESPPIYTEPEISIPEPITSNPPVQSNESEAAATVCTETTISTNSCEDESDSGLAGAFAQLTLGAPRTAEQSALDDHLRRQGWEVGNIDYMGRDSFDNIWSKICQTLSSGPPLAEKPAEPAVTPTPATQSESRAEVVPQQTTQESAPESCPLAQTEAPKCETCPLAEKPADSKTEAPQECPISCKPTDKPQQTPESVAKTAEQAPPASIAEPIPQLMVCPKPPVSEPIPSAAPATEDSCPMVPKETGQEAEPQAETTEAAKPTVPDSAAPAPSPVTETPQAAPTPTEAIAPVSVTAAPQTPEAPATAAPQTPEAPASVPVTAAPQTPETPASVPVTATPQIPETPPLAPQSAAPQTPEAPAPAPETAAPQIPEAPALAPESAAPQTTEAPAPATESAAPQVPVPAPQISEATAPASTEVQAPILTSTETPVPKSAPTETAPVPVDIPVSAPTESTAPGSAPTEALTPAAVSAEAPASVTKTSEVSAPSEAPVKTPAPSEVPAPTPAPSEAPAPTPAPSEVSVPVSTPGEIPATVQASSEAPVEALGSVPTEVPVSAPAPAPKTKETSAPSSPTTAPTSEVKEAPAPPKPTPAPPQEVKKTSAPSSPTPAPAEEAKEAPALSSPLAETPKTPEAASGVAETSKKAATEQQKGAGKSKPPEASSAASPVPPPRKTGGGGKKTKAKK